MSDDDPQGSTLTFLQKELAARGGVPVREAQTHVSRVFLSPALAWKVKKPVTLPYLDFGTAPLRLAACERELQLNRYTQPEPELMLLIDRLKLELPQQSPPKITATQAADATSV